jgi:hypothetical protein
LRVWPKERGRYRGRGRKWNLRKDERKGERERKRRGRVRKWERKRDSTIIHNYKTRSPLPLSLYLFPTSMTMSPVSRGLKVVRNGTRGGWPMFFCLDRIVDTRSGAWARMSLTLMDRVPEGRGGEREERWWERKWGRVGVWWDEGREEGG